MFIIKIKDLSAQTTLGVYEWEKQAKRPVILNIEMVLPNGQAGKSDNVNDTVDYALIEQAVIERLAMSSYNLIERLVEDIAALILSSHATIEAVTIEADKPGALKQAPSVSVKITRSRIGA